MLQHMGPVDTVIHPEYKHAPDGSKTKALAWFGTKDVRIVEAPVPAITEPDDVIVKVTGTTICGSDLHLCVSCMLFHTAKPSLISFQLKISWRNHDHAKG